MDKRYEKLGLTGWSLEDNNFQGSADCAKVRSSSFAHFRNGIFCAAVFFPPFAFFPTHTRYDRNTVEGYADGTSGYFYNWSKSGGCSSLLAFRHRIE